MSWRPTTTVNPLRERGNEVAVADMLPFAPIRRVIWMTGFAADNPLSADIAFIDALTG